jgi:ubiquinone/menaquinone biosynthesis C-methylase UbiE
MTYGDFAYVYDSLMKDFNYGKWKKYIEDIFKLYGISPVNIVDLACGTGTMSILLAQQGYNVVGIDKSEDMLFVAKEKSRKQGLNIPFICQDMQELELHHPADAVLVMCDGFNYITDEYELSKAMLSIYKALKSRGILIFDISSYYKLASILGNRLMADNNEKISFIWQNYFNPEDNICQMELTFFVNENGYYRRFDEVHYQRAYRLEEIIEILEQSGYIDIRYFHPFTFKPPKKRGQRIVFAAMKP